MVRKAPFAALVAILLAITYLGGSSAAASTIVDPEAEVRSLGTALEGFPVASAAFDEQSGSVYVGSFDLSPTRVVKYDVESGEVTDDVVIPNGLRPWAMGVVDGLVYLNTQHHLGDGPNFFRYDPTTGEVEALGRVGMGGTKVAGSPDGRVYMGVGTTIYEYDPNTDEISEFYSYPHADVNVDVEKVTETTIYASTTWQEPDLIAIDRDTLEEERFLPPELAHTNGIYDLRVTDDWIFASAGVEGLNALINRDDLDDYTIVRTPTEVDAYAGRAAISADTVYFAGIRSGVIYAYDIAADELDQLVTPIAGAPTRQLYLTNDDTSLLGVSASGAIWNYELATGQLDVVDLVEAGAAGGPQATQSLLATDDSVFVGGNNAFEQHLLSGDGSTRVVVAGEVKAMASTEAVTYMAMYSHGQLLRYEPRATEADLVADWEDRQNRPRAAAFDDVNDLILVGTRSDSLGGGALVVYDVASGVHDLYPNPLGEVQAVRHVLAHEGVAYLAGGRSDDARVSAWDPVAGAELWSTVPAPDAGPIVGFTMLGDRLVAVTASSTVLILDPASGQVIEEASFGAGVGPLVTHGGDVYSTDGTALYRLDLESLEFATVVRDLEAPFTFGNPPLSSNGQHLYLLSGTQLLEVDVPTGPQSKTDCFDGGWKRYDDPGFRNQGQCVATVARNG